MELAVAVTVTGAVTCFSYYLIERPALSLKRSHKEAKKQT